MKHKTPSVPVNLLELAATGYWFCLSCCHVTEKNESDNGQPAVCSLCGSPRIKFCPPVFSPEKSDLMLENSRAALDTACNNCMDALRGCVEQPNKANLDALTRAIAKAHQSLLDLNDAERNANTAYKTA